MCCRPEPTKTKRSTVGIILDRKSTRLNSSHLGISYAVFCFCCHLVLHPFPTRRSSDLRRAWLPPRGGRWRLPAGVVLCQRDDGTVSSGARMKGHARLGTERCAVGPSRLKLNDLLSE